MWD
ncbi:hypothetical protein D039_3425A, partial [Vibrio parahaemolyticus EKP-028]|jgi:hypothetical protein